MWGYLMTNEFIYDQMKRLFNNRCPRSTTLQVKIDSKPENLQ